MIRSIHFSNLKKHWVFPLLAGCLIIFLSLLGISSKAISLMEADKVEETGKTIDAARRSIDHSLFTLQSSAAELMMNNQNMVLQAAKDDEAFTASATYRYSELMKNIKLANDLIQDIYLYYPAQDYIVGTEGSYASKSYYLLTNKLIDEGYASWKTSVLESRRQSFFFSADKSGGQNLYFRQQMPAALETSPMSVLIINVDETEFIRLLDMALPHDGTTAISVFNSDNSLYQSGSENKELFPSPQEILDSFPGGAGEMEKMENNSYIGWRLRSEHEAFYYVVLSSKSALEAHIKPIQRLLILGVVVCTGIGLIISLALGLKQHRTIEETINSLNDKVIWSYKEKNLTEILSQRLGDPDVARNLFQAGGIPLDYVYFCFVLADVSFEKNKGKIKEWFLAAGKRLEQENESVDVIPALLGSTAVFLLNYEEADDQLPDRMQELFREECRHTVETYHSEVFLTADQLVPIYEQTLLQFQEKLGVNRTPISREKEGALILDRWLKALHLREYAKAGALIPDLFEAWVFCAEDSYIQVSRQYTVINNVLSQVEKEDKRYHTNHLSTWKDWLKTCGSGAKLQEELSKILSELETQSSQYTLRQKDRLAPKIKAIIESAYDQHYLGLYYISEQVNVSTSYVSKVFKEEYGIGIVEYMNRLRIEKAKKIMQNEALTVKEIAEKVGFTSDIHFIRIFKKFENTTPGVYRKQNQS